MSCRSVFTALCATGLQCPAGKTLPLLPSLPSASQDTACFSLQESVTLRMRLEFHFSALQLLKVPLYPSAPPRRHQLSNGAVLELGTDDSRTLVITKIFINLKCQPLLLSQPSQTCLESKWCLSLASYMGDSAAHRLTSI